MQHAAAAVPGVYHTPALHLPFPAPLPHPTKRRPRRATAGGHGWRRLSASQACCSSKRKLHSTAPSWATQLPPVSSSMCIPCRWPGGSRVRAGHVGVRAWAGAAGWCGGRGCR